jgi:hypothetical protein
MPIRRFDVLDCKAELAVALGDKKSTYWKLLKDFMLGRLRRSQLDSIARQLLGPKQGGSLVLFLLDV